MQNEDPSYSGGANGVSLNEGKENFARYGAIKKEFSNKVRRPLANEMPS